MFVGFNRSSMGLCVTVSCDIMSRSVVKYEIS